MRETKQKRRPTQLTTPVLEYGKIPPNVVELEEAVLGAIMIESVCLIEVMPILRPEDFYRIEHQKIFAAIERLYSTESKVDILTVTNECKKEGDLELVGGAFYISQLTDRVASSANVEEHAYIILENSVKREQIRICGDAYNMAYDDMVEAGEVAEYLSIGLETIAERMAKSGDESNDKILSELQKKIEKANEKGGITGLTTGIKELDRIYCGRQDGSLIIKAGRPSMGKLQPLTEPVLTPNGWVNMGEIKSGSDVSCPVTGSSIKVIQTFPQDDVKIYRVTFGDGTYTECCNEHLWLIQTAKDKLRNKSRVVDLNWIIEQGVLDGRKKSKFSIPLTNPIHFSKKEIGIKAYLMGQLIGNGYLSEVYPNTLSVHQDDLKEIHRYIKPMMPTGVHTRANKKGDGNKSSSISLTYKIRKSLEEVGLLGIKSREKFIPRDYLFNTVDVRKELLAGLLDSDGSCFTGRNSKQISYSTMSVQLKDDIIELVRSLGGIASPSCETREKYRGGTCWNISIRTPFNPFKLHRKREKYDARSYTHYFRKHIRSVEYLRNDKGQCILVDSPHHLYVTRNYTVTHNTSSALSEVVHIGVDLGLPVIFFSLEMGKVELMRKIISMVSGIDNNKMKTGNMSKDDWSKFHEAAARVSNSKIIIIDGVNELSAIKGISMRFKASEQGLRAIYIDYLQLIEYRIGKSGNRQDEVSAISRELKKLCVRLDVPLIALSQLSRAVETRGGSKKPMLSDLRESGSIEQDADIVEFLYRPEYYGIKEAEGYPTTKGLSFTCVAKHRDGGLKDVPMKWDYKKTQFVDWVVDEETVVTKPNEPSIDDLDDLEEEVF